MTLIPSYFNLFDYFLGDERLAEIGRLTAIEFRGGRITYDELRREVDYWAGYIMACGVGEGDRVAMLLYDSPEFIACFLATVSIGAVCVPINTFLPAEDVMFILSDSGARLVIAEDELEWKTDLSDSTFDDKCSLLTVDTAARHYLDPKDDVDSRRSFPATTEQSPAFLLYTSGSTGAPKGVLHLHGAIPHTVRSYSANVLRLSAEDRVYSSSRMFFAYGFGNSLSFPLAAGATAILDSERPTPDRIAKLFEEQRPSVFFGVPAVYRSLLEFQAGGSRLDASALRMCVSAGEALPARVFEDWRREFGPVILDGIGSTEMLHIFISNTEGAARAGSSGRAVEGYEARLLGDDGREVRGEELGNLWVRGASATAGYWNRPELTQETVRDGWVRTGDIYRKDGEGFYYHVGRSDDCFKVRGLWVSPIEVESVLMAHESVVEAAVVSNADENGLATVMAYVVIRTDGDAEALKEELHRFAGSRLPKYKVPSGIEFITEMPRTSTGKIQRFKLRAAGRRHRSGGSDDQ
ncbi:MAG TPA: benzoate-CoA ligase family protein [Blastocatellia bacterium]|jgi:benzoate-CoA ligase|nr:benzoate-CoA ligase family protein [Blastocatellia bacterium]